MINSIIEFINNFPMDAESFRIIGYGIHIHTDFEFVNVRMGVFLEADVPLKVFDIHPGEKVDKISVAGKLTVVNIKMTPEEFGKTVVAIAVAGYLIYVLNAYFCS